MTGSTTFLPKFLLPSCWGPGADSDESLVILKRLAGAAVTGEGGRGGREPLAHRHKLGLHESFIFWALSMLLQRPEKDIPMLGWSQAKSFPGREGYS